MGKLKPTDNAFKSPTLKHATTIIKGVLADKGNLHGMSLPLLGT